MARVCIEQLSKGFPVSGAKPVQALKNLSLTVEDKELLVLVGPSGCGKTTTLRLIAGLEEPSAGTISLDGQVLNDIPPQERDVAMVFQSHALYPHLTVFENMALGLKLRKRPSREIQSVVKEAAQLLELTTCLNMRPEQLSGGQRQRVALGRAIVRRPRLFLLDEPLSSLDAPLRVQMRGEIVRLQRQLGITMILVTHDQNDAMSMGDRIAVLKSGELQQVATPQDLYCKPANRFVASFIGIPPMQFIPGVVRRREAGLWFEPRTKGQVSGAPVDKSHFPLLDSQIDREILLGLRPEHFSASNSTNQPAGNWLATVEWTEFLGAETILHVNLEEILLRLRQPQVIRLKRGEKLGIVPNMSQATYFEPETGQALDR